MRRLLLASALLLTAWAQHPTGACSQVRVTSDGYVCSRAAFEEWSAYQTTHVTP